MEMLVLASIQNLEASSVCGGLQALQCSYSHTKPISVLVLYEDRGLQLILNGTLMITY